VPFQILSLSGGGFLGLYTVTVLAEIEAFTGRPIREHFDLIAGTSVGGIIALGLAAGRSASDIQIAFAANGPAIFSDRPAPQTTRQTCIDVYRSFFHSKYDGKALRKTIVDVLGETTTLGDLHCPVVIPAVNLTKGKPQVFKTDHHPDFKLDYKLRAADVALATSAAPTYFPIAEIGDELFVDGGLYANSPDIIALHEAEYFFGVLCEDVKMLSIGTTTTQFSFSHTGPRNLGILGWSRRFAQTVISSQQLDTAYILGHRLNERYLRIDEVQSREQERDLGLDVATAAAQQTIRGLASGSFQANINKPVLIDMLAYTAPSPRFLYRNATRAR
jgi:uncharacterized protein